MQKSSNPLKEFFVGIAGIVKEESHGFKKLEEEKIKKLQELFGFSNNLDSVYYNDFNLYFFNYEDYKPFQFIFPDNLKFMHFDMPEFGQFLYVMRYSQDSVLSSVISI